MNKAFKILSLSFVLLLGIVFFAFGTSAANENGILYSVSGGEATVTGFSEEITEALVIPSTLGGYPVTAIGDSAFEYQWDMPSVVVPEGVRTIGSQAFRCCYALEEITLPSTLTFVDNSTFEWCEILRVNHPDLAKWVQIDFDGMEATPVYWDDDEEDPLTEIYFGDSTEPIRDVVIPEGVTRIGTWVFGNNETIESLVIPDSVTEIGERAFFDCGKLLSVDFGEGLERIGEFAFDGCESLGNFTLPDSLLTIGDWAFSSNTAITEVTVPDKVEVIPLGAFSYCVALETVNIGAGVETIGQQAFYRAGLTEVIIPDNVIAIDLRAFQECKELETAVIGDGVTTVADKVFYDCTALKNLTIGDSLTSYPENFLKLQDKKESDYIPDDWLHIEKLTVGDGLTSLPAEIIKREYLKEIVIGDGITEIADYQFTSFSKLEKVVLGDNIRAIGNEAFYRCTALNELKLPANLETVGNRAFCVCSDLTEIVIPATVVSLGESAFGACSSAESVTFEGNALRTIGDGAFSECSALTAIAIPEGVTHLGSNMFYWSENLVEINLPDSLVSIKSGLIYYTPYDDDYDYDEDMLYIGNHLINGGYYSTPAKYVVRKGTKSIAQYAFSNDHSLETVVIHKGLVSIDDDAFNDCPNLTKICFTGTETEWNQILKGNNDFSAYTIEYNFYVCPHENTENKDAIVTGCNTYGYTEGIYCNDCNEWLKGHKQLAFAHKDNNGDAACDECQAVVSDIMIDVSKRIIMGEFDTELRFVAPASGEYTFTSVLFDYADPYIIIYDANDNFVASNYDISYDDYNFNLVCTLEKDKSYILYVGSFCNGDIFDMLLSFDCEHTGGTATCKTRAECTVCGMQYGSFNMNNHTALTVIPAEAANCGKEGKTAGEKCTACGTVTVAQTLVPATGNHTGGTATCKSKAVCTVCEKEYGSLNANSHKNITTLKAVAATCTKTGKTEGKKCSDCGKVTVAQNTVPAKGHKLTTLKAVAATCTKTGKTEGKKCSVCGTVTVAQKTLAKKAHTYKTTTTKATLKKNGKQVTKCSVCGYVSKTTTVYYPKTIKLSTTSYTCNGKAKTPSVTVKDSKGNTLKKDTDYTVKYASGRKNPGKYTVTITFKGKYEGTKKLTFTIKPAKAALSKVTAGSKQATVAWKAVSGATGYEVQYSTSSKLRSSKTATVKKGSTKKTTIKKLTKGKKYYFRVRAYKTIDGKKVYGAWSSVKSVKIK
ncbi:MAG: leucine-rich repeat protein [Clostridia bacterium]|nr:leucine-rich repeat protein [Clostridia bacterium]